MKYDLRDLAVIHWNYNKDFPISIDNADNELFPKYQLYPNEEYVNRKLILIRWTFRAYKDNNQLLSYIGEQTCLLNSEDGNNDAIPKLKEIFKKSFSEYEAYFNMAKKGTSFPTYQMKKYQIPEDTFLKILHLL